MLKSKILLKFLTAITISVPFIASAQNIYQNNSTFYGGNTYQEAGHTYYGSKPTEVRNSKNNENVQMNKPVEQIKSETQQTKFVNPNRTASTSTDSNENVYYMKGSQTCFEQAAAFHRVDPWLLVAIASVESGFNANAINRNKNGSYDVGMMQINSIWLPTLKKKGIDASLLKNACASTYIGAWILSDNIRRYGYTWRAIGAYNSGNPKIGLVYAKKVYAAHAKILAMRGVGN